jgi:hypothetical protein
LVILACAAGAANAAATANASSVFDFILVSLPERKPGTIIGVPDSAIHEFRISV